MGSYFKLNQLPLGSIKAEGYLKEQLMRLRDGIGGHLDELEPEMIAKPYVEDWYVEAWTEDTQCGWSAEISGNYWTGLILLAYTLDDGELLKKAEKWVGGVLATQRKDGYMGTYRKPDAPAYQDFNAWGTACGMRALMLFYEATGREDVLEAVYRCLLWFCDNWAGDKKTIYGGVTIVGVMTWCYRYRQDERLVQFCEDYYAFLSGHHPFHNALEDYLSDWLPYNSCHSAGYGNFAKQPAELYDATGDPRHLEATVNAMRKVRAHCTHPSGGVVSNSEYLGPLAATAETEYCSFTLFHSAYELLACATGEAVYGDYAEQIFYNGAQGARKKDERAIAYMSAPNQIFATEHSGRFHDMQVYAPCYPTSCCPVNAVVLPPDFVRSMALTDAEKNLYFPLYGPCKITYGGMTVCEETLYPFRNEVHFTVNGAGRRTLHFRIPQWSEGFALYINGAAADAAPEQNGYVPIAREWSDGDSVTLTFHAKPRVMHIDDSDASGQHPLAFAYGALLFSLPIPERWKEIKGSPNTPLPEEWSWFDVEPELVFDEPGKDTYDAMSRVRERTVWNVAVDEDISAAEVSVKEDDTPGYVWENPRLKLCLKGYKAPLAYAPYIDRTAELYGAYQEISHPVELELVPYGCTNLRITYFPRAKKETESV